LATEDMFVWRTDEAGLPFFVPNRAELLDLYRSIIDCPGVEQITLSHATIAPALVDPDLIGELSESCSIGARFDSKRSARIPNIARWRL